MSLLTRGTGVALQLLLATQLLTSQQPSRLSSSGEMGSTNDKLASLQTCLAGKPSSIDRLTNGLLFGYSSSDWNDSNWQDQRRPPQRRQTAKVIHPPPPQYLASLDRDVAACKLALVTQDPTMREAIMDSVRKDVEIKADDCRQFGMGRLVTVRVVTILNNKADNGWEVYYKWTCLSGFETDEFRTPGMTSPAIITLAPGEYTVRAEKKMPGASVKKSDGIVMVFGMSQTIDLEIPVS